MVQTLTSMERPKPHIFHGRPSPIPLLHPTLSCKELLDRCYNLLALWNRKVAIVPGCLGLLQWLIFLLVSLAVVGRVAGFGVLPDFYEPPLLARK